MCNNTPKLLHSLPPASLCGRYIPLLGGATCSNALQSYQLFSQIIGDPGSQCIASTILKGVIVDGGSRIHLMPEYTVIGHPARFFVTMVGQCIFSPMGLIENVQLQIQERSFFMNFVALRLPRLTDGFPLLIGHPWLRYLKAVQEWS